MSLLTPTGNPLLTWERNRAESHRACPATLDGMKSLLLIYWHLKSAYPIHTGPAGPCSFSGWANWCLKNLHPTKKPFWIFKVQDLNTPLVNFQHFRNFVTTLFLGEGFLNHHNFTCLSEIKWTNPCDPFAREPATSWRSSNNVLTWMLLLDFVWFVGETGAVLGLVSWQT